MRILLDECVDESLRHHFPGHDCQSCRFAGFKGLSNGRLLAAAIQAGFEVLITVDQNLRNQQNLAGSQISVVVLQNRSTNIEDVLPLMPQVLVALETLSPGQVVLVGSR